MLSEIYHNIYCLPISTVVLIMAILTPIFGVGIAQVKRKWPKQTRIVCLVLSALYVFFILCLTVLNRNVKAGESPELIPFSFFIRAQEQPELYREVVMNIFLFWPLGLFLPQGAERVKDIEIKQGAEKEQGAERMTGKHPVLTTVLFSFILSVAIETIQYIFSLGLVETDDVIANTVGAAIGTISFLICSLCLKKYNNPS